MGYMHEFPSTRMFDSDLKEIIQLYFTVVNLPTSWEEYKKLMDGKYEDLKEFINKYFDDVNLQNEVNNKIDEMASDGSLAKIINIDILNQKTRIVNVKGFGAVGDGVTDDTEALDKALAYADLHNIHTIYFPDGTYNLPNRSYIIDTSKQSWVGENTTKLKSSGLEYTAFISLISPLTLNMYDYARVPLSNICIEGTYNNDSADTGVVGIYFGRPDSPAETLVSPHMALYNVTVRNFAIGINLASAYKSSAYNLNIMACNYGIWISDGGIVPWNCYCCHIECCYYAIYSLADGYAEARFFGGAFEYNRMVFTGYGRHTFVGVRFEFDFLSACNSELVTQSVFNLTSPTTGYLKFTDCSFLLLPNFEANVGYWIQEPYRAHVNNNPVIFAYSSTYSGKCQIMLENCEIATADSTQYPGGNYMISGQKLMAHNNVYSGENTNIIQVENLVEEANGFIQ